MGEPFQKERASIEQRLLDEKRNTFFSTYLAMTQKQMTDEGKISYTTMRSRRRWRQVGAVPNGTASAPLSIWR